MSGDQNEFQGLIGNAGFREAFNSVKGGKIHINIRNIARDFFEVSIKMTKKLLYRKYSIKFKIILKSIISSAD